MLCVSCSAGTLCFELMKGIPASFVALVIGGIAAWIAFHQYRVARTKLKLDLFDKRYDIFIKTWGHLSEMVQKGVGPIALSDFDNERPRAGFLFGQDIESYLSEISSQRTKLWTINARIKATCGNIPLDIIKEDGDLSNWFLHEAQSGAKHRFAPYLDFSQWK